MDKIKICLIGINFSNGGAERVHAVLSEFFVSKGFEVHNVLIDDSISYQFSGKMVNLGRTKKSKLSKFIFLKRYFDNENFDYIIDFRYRINQWREWLLAKFVYRNYIVTVHSYRTEWYFPTNKFLARTIFKNAFQIVAVSDEIEKKVREIYGYKSVLTIYNMLEFEKIDKAAMEEAPFHFSYILAAGRMTLDNNKQFDKLIEMYASSSLPQKNIRLVFLGDGPQKSYLKHLSRQKELQDLILFEGFQNNPFVYMKHALFTTLTSVNEGLPNILTESLACGTPVISFDCKSGPSEIIINHENGLLVEDQNFDAFLNGMDELVNDANLLNYLKSNARESVKQFSPEVIGNRWLKLLEKV